MSGARQGHTVRPWRRTRTAGMSVAAAPLVNQTTGTSS